VPCVDEKSQIQALDRTQPGLPLQKGRAATMTHDDKRHGTTTLFAALDVTSGLVIGDGMPRHRARKFLTYLRRIDRAARKPRDIHILRDSHATRKAPEGRAWLEEHPRFRRHFAPTSASWLNLVGRFFAEIAAKRIRRGSYSRADGPETARHDCLLPHNACPQPFVWSKTAEDIITRERRALDARDEIRGNRQQVPGSQHQRFPGTAPASEWVAPLGGAYPLVTACGIQRWVAPVGESQAIGCPDWTATIASGIGLTR
jgi:transposase